MNFTEENPKENLNIFLLISYRNSIHGTAICAFNISSINDAFNGPFKYQKSMSSSWEREDNNRPNGCRPISDSSKRNNLVIESRRYQLMDQTIQSTTSQPLFVSKLERFTHIALDIIPTKLHERVHIIFVATTDGLVKKLSVLPRTKETCVIEIWQPQIQNTKILTMKFLKHTESLYIGTDEAIIKIPAQHCERHGSRASCMNAMDPYCGWNDLAEKCTPPPDGETLTRFWLQNSTECPVLTAPIDGGWSSWSEWSKCAQHSDGQLSTESTHQDTCLCRTRNCNNPSPRNGGVACKGMSISVSNCTVNGGWTEWSPWSACSQTCGIAVKTRRRTCGNPKPAHSGRVCVGSDRQEIYCQHLPPCPEPKQPPIDGNWGPWSSWSECSAMCGGGFRFRRRKCDDPRPQNGGMECIGCDMDYEICNQQQCAEIKKMSSWTPWLSNGTTADGGHLEKRFRFSCRAVTTDTNNVKVTMAKEEARVCQADGACLRGNYDSMDDFGWSDWGTWSACSVACGGGQQYRTRTCEKHNCTGNDKMARACNTHPCKG